MLLAIGSGCAVDSLPDRLAIPSDDPSFRSRIYGGASVGNSTLTPDTDGTVYGVANKEAVATQLRLGIDLHSRLSLELDSSMLGSAELDASNADVQFASLGASALIYGLTGSDERVRRQGLSGYLRLGYAGIKKASVVQPLDGSDSGAVLGIGAEFGFANGLGLRAEATQINDEAVFIGFGAVYRLGVPPSEVKNVFLAAANAVGEQTQESPERRRSLFGNNQTSGAMAQQTAVPVATRHDKDADGVKNKQDACEKTPLYVAVDQRGCGLFDKTMSGVTFKPGSYAITPLARAEIKKLSATLQAFPEVRVQVQAHTDSQGDNNLNEELSRKRAKNVVDYLVKLGVPREQLSARGMGSSVPIASNDSLEGRAVNRRISLLTLPSFTAEQLSALSLNPDPADSGNSASTSPKIEQRLTNEVVAKLARSVKHTRKPIFPAVATAAVIKPLPATRNVAGLKLNDAADAMKFVSANSASLTEPARLELKKLQQKLDRHPDVRVSVHAHLDERESERATKKLSEDRAAGIVAELVSMGVPTERLEYVGYGSSLPIAQSLSEEDRARNRRVEFRIIP